MVNINADGQDEVEPIWATAARNGVSFATFLWGR